MNRVEINAMAARHLCITCPTGRRAVFCVCSPSPTYKTPFDGVCASEKAARVPLKMAVKPLLQSLWGLFPQARAAAYILTPSTRQASP